MRRAICGAVVFGLAAFAAGVSAQEAVTIKEYKSKPGDRYRVSLEDKATTKTSFTAGGQQKELTEENVKKTVYHEEVLERPADAKRATKLRRTYETAEVTKNGKADKSPLDGKTVLIEKKGDKYAFAYEGGGAVDGKAAEALNTEFNTVGGPFDSGGLVPDKPVKPGDTWPIDKDKFARALAKEGLKIDKAKTTVTGKLVKAYTRDGRQFGVLEYDLDIPITDLGPKVPVTVKEGSKMTHATTVDTCIDGTDPTERETTKVKLMLVGSGNGVDLTIESSGTITKTREPLRKK